MYQLLFPGIQHAGGHLKELQKAVKDPISNFGVVLGEVTKRGKSAMGFGGGNVLSGQVFLFMIFCRNEIDKSFCLQVHKNLDASAANVCKSVELFGTTIEKLLIKHGRTINHIVF